MNDTVYNLAERVAEAAHLVASANTPDLRLQRMQILREATEDLFAAGIEANINQVTDWVAAVEQAIDKLEAEQDAS